MMMLKKKKIKKMIKMKMSKMIKIKKENDYYLKK